MALTFITGNAGKFQAAQLVFPEIQQLDLDLDEVQSTDPQVVIEHKLRQALSQHEGEFVVEDTSVEIEALNGLPGPLIKWFLQKLGTEGIARLAATGSARCVARTILGYSSESGEMQYFSAEVAGTIVPPRGSFGFGWDAIFQPLDSDRTFGEMTPQEKSQYSMRQQAFLKLKTYLEMYSH